MIYVPVGLIGLIILILVVGSLLSWNTPLLTRGPTPTPTMTPEQVKLQLVSTSERWTETQTIGIDCLMTVCSRQVSFGLTLLTTELLEDMVREDLSRGMHIESDFEERVVGLKRRLNSQDQLVFALAVIPHDALIAPRSEVTLGPLRQNLALLTTTDQAYAPVQSDPLFDQPIALNVSHKGFVSFPRRDDQGQDLLEGRSLTLRLNLNESLNSDQSAVVWNFDLVAPARPEPAIPTSTPGPTPTPGPPLVDREVILEIIDLLTEVVRTID